MFSWWSLYTLYSSHAGLWLKDTRKLLCFQWLRPYDETWGNSVWCQMATFISANRWKTFCAVPFIRYELKFVLYAEWIQICGRDLPFNRSTLAFYIILFHTGTDSHSQWATQWLNLVLFESLIGVSCSIYQKRRKKVSRFQFGGEALVLLVLVSGSTGMNSGTGTVVVSLLN